MLPLEIFRSRQFSAANAVTFVVYAALGGFFFLLVAFLQISMGYTPVEAGAASMPVTLLMMTAIGPDDSYLASVLPAVVVFGLGLTLVVAPVTATVLAALGGLIAWLTIAAGVLHPEAEPGGGTPERLAEDFECAVNGPPLRPAREAECSVAPPH